MMKNIRTFYLACLVFIVAAVVIQPVVAQDDTPDLDGQLA